MVKYEGGQIIPSEGGGAIKGDGYPETWPEYILLDKPHPILDIEVWNEGNDYEHDVKLDIVVLPMPIDPLAPLRDFIAILKRVMGL